MITQSQLLSLADGIDQSLNTTQGRIAAEVLAESFPLIADGMADAAQAGEQALEATRRLAEALHDALTLLAAATSQTEQAVEIQLNTALANAGFQGTALSVTVVGDEVRISLATDAFGSYVQDLAPDLGLGQFGLAGGGTGTLETVFGFDMDFATDSSGFFIDTSAAAEITIDLALSDTLFDQVLNINGQDFVSADAGTTFVGSIAIDIQAAANRLGTAQVASATMDATLTGSAGVQVGLTAADQGAMSLPIGATLSVDWDFDAAEIDPFDTNAGFGDRPDVRFDTVTIGLGDFMEDFVAPLIERIDQLLEPIRPILTVLTTSIKVLEDFPGLGSLFDVTNDGKVNLLDILKVLFPSTNFTAVNAIVDLAEQVVSWADFLASTGFADGELILGDIDLGNIDIRLPSFDLDSVSGQLAGIADNLQDVLDTLSGAGWDTADGGSGDTGLDILQSIVDNDIFDLPVLDDPTQWINLIVGRPADLIYIDLPELVLGDRSDPIEILSLPIIPLVFLKVTAAVEAVINFDFGFDTRGLLDPARPAIDGFYIVDLPDESEITLYSSIGLGVSLDLLLAEAYGGGDIAGEIELDLNSGSTEGKLYYDEFIAAVNSNPFAIFDASGSITAGFTAYVDTLFGEIWRWESPRITLGGFGFDETGTAVVGTVSGGTLTLFTGGRADQRTNGALIGDVAEIITIAPKVTGGIAVTVLGMSQEFTGVTDITGNGQTGDDQLVVDPTLVIPVNFWGGEGNDGLSGGAGDDTFFGGLGDDALIGNDGDDSLTGALGDDYLEGGAGADTINGGEGNDWVSYRTSDAAVDIDLSAATQSGGDAQGDELFAIENIDGSEHGDSIVGSQGAGSFFGRGGDDLMTGGTHVQYLFGNDGDDTMEASVAGSVLAGGEGDDLYIVRAAGMLVGENFLSEIAAGSDSGHDSVEAYVSIDLRGTDEHIEDIQLFGSALTAHANGLDNLIEGNSRDNGLYGYGGDDTIRGYAGKDTLYGHDGNDLLAGGDGDDELRGGSGDDILNGLDGEDNLFGDDGDDTVTGGFGFDTLRGGAGADELLGGFDADFYIVDSDDTVYEINGGGIDFVWADEDHALLAGQEIEVLSAYSWEGILAAITATLINDTRTGYEGLAQLIGVNGILGATPTVALTGNERAQLIIGETGDSDIVAFRNVLEGMDGADTILGDDRDDVAQYLASDAAVQIDLSQEIQSGGHAEGDRLIRIHNIIGSAHDDTILGEDAAASGGAIPAADNLFEGRGGNDLLEGLDGFDTLLGGWGADTLKGGNEDDDLQGEGGADSLEGGNGNDTLDGGAGIDVLDGGAGDDLYYVTLLDDIFDSSGDDTAIATTDYTLNAGAEVERLEASTDTDDDLILFGNTFAQWIAGNAGDNFLHGGAGADTIQGRAGQDTAGYTLSLAPVDVDLNRAVQSGGHAEGDELIGIENLSGSGFGDVLVGLTTVRGDGLEDNRHAGLAGDDWIEDTIGTNTLEGGFGDDTLVGSGTEALVAGAGSLLLGGAGNDSLDAGVSTNTGGDTLAGGMGDDIYRVTSAGDVVDENWAGDIAEGADGGHDTLISDVTVWNMETPGQASIEDAELGLGRDLLANALDNHVTGNDLDNDLTGREGNDTLLGRLGNDTLRGGLGDDNLNGGAGDDQMIGWAGDDLYIVDSAGDVVMEAAGNGTDTVRSSVDHTLADEVEVLVLTGTDDIDGTGNALDNRLEGNTGANLLSGGEGNDTLNGGAGVDTLRGGLGDDVFAPEGLDEIDSITGGDGIDLLDMTLHTGGALTADLAAETYTVGGPGGVQTIRSVENIIATGEGDAVTGNEAANRFEGRAGADTMAGGAGDDWLDGEAGTDSLDGGDGNDTILGGNGHDTLFGRAGDDSLLGGGGRDEIRAGDGFDSLYGEDGDDWLIGGNDADFAEGGTGDDTLSGNDGNDNLIGGEGNDLFYGGSGNDTLTGEAGDDTAYGGGGRDRLTGLDGNDTLFGGNGQDSLYGGAGTDNLVGGGGQDLIFGGDEDDTLLGQAGRDTLFGGAGDDLLSGGTEADSLTGGDGDDSLHGGTGPDVLTGGMGADVFVFSTVADSPPTQADRITDFETGIDRIDLAAIDADIATGTDDSFAFIGTGAFTAAGQLRFGTNGTDGLLQGDVDGDGNADLSILLEGVTALTPGDVIL
ncbi:M10 family metallopeptidase C-terminal domain-containing protein [Thetidibacter halocola]|uniref:M10 family metallopeptidase C-terminal domain-containing protein n=1 Tax=Thetidibacter halocola TaxID=2827239 RepID=A0A8J7W904_9RHOB|nr:M10 family metallopeptidase C-terminal domain-containing protein [Thetidibacter halocola]MBS0123127.1 M10 family metallopeptidase C-terminal domain-containing protein [Thetidibacter halocola]